MSTRAETYVIYGRKLDVDLIKNEKSHEIPEELYFPWCGEGAKDTLGVLYDGMNGAYCIAGYCIAVGSEWDGPELGLVEIDCNTIDIDMLEKVNTWIHGNMLYIYIQDEETSGNKIWILTHYH
jgi:hypothetical protein